MPERILVALGGNALIKTGQKGTIQEQISNLDETLSQLVELIFEGHRLVITHGNGPQVGHILIRVEEARGKAYDLPLDVCVAQTQGAIGYLIQQRLHNLLERQKINRQVSTVVSQVVVDANDPRMKNPSKPVGPFYRNEEVGELKKKGYSLMEDAHRGYRRVVPSPLPTRVLETEIIHELFDNGTIVIAVGGGGIPVCIQADGTTKAVEAVVDKDWSSSLLAVALGIERMLNLTAVDHAKLHFDSHVERNLEVLTVHQAKAHLAEGHFMPGSMEPKIESAIYFLENGGREVIITSPEKALQGYTGKTGTHVFQD